MQMVVAAERLFTFCACQRVEIIWETRAESKATTPAAKLSAICESAFAFLSEAKRIKLNDACRLMRH